MQTLLRGTTKIVTVDTHGPMTVIGESINPTRRKRLTAAFTDRQYDYVLQLATEQAQAGADVLDINVGVPGINEAEVMRGVVLAVSAYMDIPLCLDSNDPVTLAAGLAVAPGRPLINSVNGEEKSLAAILPVAKEFGVPVIGLVIDDDGISMEPEKRLAIAGKIIERAAALGIPIEDIIIDPLAMAISADHGAGLVTLRTIDLIHREFGVNMTLGASNVSFGLPERGIVNQAFMALVIQLGVSCAITNPEKLTSTIRAIDLLLGRDEYSSRYIRHYRQMQKLSAGKT
ncbi:MAG: dihydropteroate synthase [Caldilineaceae bacterium]|nr:dihydropteroate synthase [Caldilineaceae bacterium]MBP8108475.1 dihydropteroate synthase [Caldilineaceae bacterium]MBP8123700.1 dihydropteroate synthase [Caldilineaceae bacterium]MBP9073824.1 dihydropteroate synthase [Caldilineaceae bacterium]